MKSRVYRKPLDHLTYVAATIAVSLIAPLFIIGATIALTFLIPGLVIDTTILTIYFIVACTLYNTFLMVVIARGNKNEGEDVGHYFSLIIPAHNEDRVIAEALNHVLNLDYPPELFEVVVINDGSTDKTREIVEKFQEKHSNLKLLNTQPFNGGRGKSVALNAGLADFLLSWRGLEVKPRHRWIIGVFDSDAAPKSNMLKKVSFQFNQQDVGGVQTLVRIRNRKRSLLAKLQDIEFLAFARAVQYARNNFAGSVALGGNGQFVRATAFDAVALKPTEEYWRNGNLTEDLELGVRLLTLKWKNVYIDTTSVSQEGTETPMTMFRQRERWAWGTLQTLKLFVLKPSFWRNNISLKVKIDISIYLVHILLPIFVSICWIWSGLSFFGIIQTSNFFPLAFTLVNGFSFLPLLGYGLLKEREEYPRWQIIPLLFLTVAYTYHWVPCVTSALVKMATAKPAWAKTPRFAMN
jgi:cellulose synthase/poly-beta-1,6-N-acetylglucosamine synthase-like glycosyltransferase